MEAAAANRRYDQIHEKRPFHDGTFTQWAESASAAFPYHYRDGVNIWVAPVDLAPHDRFLTDPNAPAVATEPEGGEDSGD